MLAPRMLSREEEAQMGMEKEVRKEDQGRINRFSRLHGHQKSLEDDLKAKEEREETEEMSNELELADEDEKVAYKIGDSFFMLPVGRVQDLLSESAERIAAETKTLEAKLTTLREEMSELKSALYGRFGQSINLEA
ncbi:Prefoldin, subunit 4 [Piedraia hortae CBS 480.64]|uniref:Prefoldin subunit 4 n=1 Tax=Piedraia hortae CBS 480.64 TaxID=1314780 RepID=A0A6A7BXX1_9PEZI|nr:Prefoldin, subunit 4 [Piedraia hortae CBS 480.64]